MPEIILLDNASGSAVKDDRSEKLMSANKPKQRRVLTLFIVAACSFLIMLLHGCVAANSQESTDLDDQRRSITYLIRNADVNLRAEISLEERIGEDGSAYYVGVLSDTLDELLEDLVKAYCADLPNAELITTEEIRLSLTEEITKTAEEENESCPVRAFLRWTGNRADLVYTDEETVISGIRYEEGDVFDGYVTNFVFLQYSDTTYSYLKFSCR
jgi:hypothetical protein